MCFAELKKAYDSVPRAKLERYWKNKYINSRAAVRIQSIGVVDSEFAVTFDWSIMV